MSQEEVMEFAREVCSCGSSVCLEDDCTACGALDPEWPCPAELEAEA
jgi:hypothetical protein